MFYTIIIPESRKWKVLGNKMECTGEETLFDSIPTIDECADKCEGISELFAYGTNDYGSDTAQICSCEIAAKDGTCQTKQTDGYRLYIYSGWYMVENLRVCNPY